MFYSALLGNPVEHSVSPKLFSYIANKVSIEYSHIKMKVEKASQLSTKIKELCDLGFCGINITCPYKINCFNLLKDIDKECKKIKSVNTIKFKNGKIIGYNTDGIAAIKSINKVKTIERSDRIVMFGAGGVARSILYELAKFTRNIIIFNENNDDTKQMLKALDFNFKFYDLKDRKIIEKYLMDADYVLNCTSEGMKPNQDLSILSLNEIANTSFKKKIYFDVVFNPWETKFLQYGHQFNNVTISGGMMLINQALYAFQIWTGIKIELSEEDITNLGVILNNETNRL